MTSRQRVGRVHRPGGDVGDQRHVLPGRQAGNQIVELKHEADVLAAVAGERGVVEFGELLPAVEHRAAGGHVEPAQDIEQRALAAAGRAQQHDELAGVQIEVDAAERVHVDFAHVIDLRQSAGGENDLGLLSSSTERCRSRDSRFH